MSNVKYQLLQQGTSQENVCVIFHMKGCKEFCLHEMAAMNHEQSARKKWFNFMRNTGMSGLVLVSGNAVNSGFLLKRKIGVQRLRWWRLEVEEHVCWALIRTRPEENTHASPSRGTLPCLLKAPILYTFPVFYFILFILVLISTRKRLWFLVPKTIYPVLHLSALPML